MTETITRGAANQAGAHLNKDAYKEAKDFLPLNGVDHVEFWVGNAKQAAHYFRALWGFTPIAYSGLETGVRDRISYVMRQNDITLVVTGALSPDGEIAEHVHQHGDGVKDIAFSVDDATSSWRETTSRGATSAIEPVELDGGEDGVLRRSAVGTYGEVRHSFIDRRDYHGVFAPGYRKVKKPARAATGMNLLEIDHCVGNVDLGDMNRFVDYYRDVFGFAQLIHYDDKVIHTEYSALMSKVMTNGNGRIKFPINEPASGKKKSQIQEFLDYYLDAGTQHIALRTEDIVGTVRHAARERHRVPGHAPRLLRDARRPGRRRRRADRDARGAGHRGRPRRGGLPPPDLHPPDPGPPDVLLRDHRAPRLARLRRRQLQGALRGDRDRAGAAREPVGRRPAASGRRRGTTGQCIGARLDAEPPR